MTDETLIDLWRRFQKALTEEFRRTENRMTARIDALIDAMIERKE